MLIIFRILKNYFCNTILYTSATLQACAGAPLDKYGFFESYNSDILPTTASLSIAVKNVTFVFSITGMSGSLPVLPVQYPYPAKCLRLS